MQRHRWVPDFRFISHYWEQEGYIQALADSVRAHWQKSEPAERLLLSFHGIPKRYFAAGDPYYCHCFGTARRLGAALGLGSDKLLVSFQSRVGKEQWLRPYTDELIKSLPAQGVQSLDVLCPGFAVDCLETIEEIAGENAEYFAHAGGKRFAYIDALNASDAHAGVLADVLRKHAQGWPEAQLNVVQAEQASAQVQAHVAAHMEANTVARGAST